MYSYNWDDDFQGFIIIQPNGLILGIEECEDHAKCVVDCLNGEEDDPL